MPPAAIVSPQVPRPRGYYSQGVWAGGLVFIAGQLPIDDDGNVVGQTAGEQTSLCLVHVASILRAGRGGT